MKKKLFFAALASIVLVGCTSNDFVGDTPPAVNGSGQAIGFGGGTGKITRATTTDPTAADHDKLDNQFLIYGVKTDGTTTSDVFQNYIVWYATGATASNPDGDWEYVGPATQTYGSASPLATIGSAQYIKYWDYSTTEYHFVAGSPVANFEYELDNTTKDIKKATVTGLGGRLTHEETVASDISPVFIAEPVIVKKADYNKEVEFSFKSMQSKVRVGIYETVPGYKITEIKFYNNATPVVKSNYITLNSGTTSYFQGGSSVTGEILYTWGTSASYTFSYGTGKETSDYWEGGEFTSGVPAVNSAETVANLYGAEDNDDDYGYFVVMPTPSGTTAAPLTLTCDYTLTSIDNSDETINVTGATATIPKEYTKWLANTAYTYLFKISDNTNGTTGSGTDPEGLYPITFDAAVVTFEENQEGTETTVSTPSITVYQEGDVVTNGITYKAGDVTVTAMVGTTDVTSSATWSYVELDGTTYDYTKDYEKLGTNGAATTWTEDVLTSVAASKTYVIKAVYVSGNDTYTAYFVLVVGAAEDGPANS